MMKTPTPALLQAIDDLEEKLLDVIEEMRHTGIPAREVAFCGVRVFSHFCFAMAPSDQVARKTIQAGVDTGFEIWEEDKPAFEESLREDQ